VKFISYLKKYADGFKPFTYVEASYLNTDMCKFESSQNEESRTFLTDSSKAYSRGAIAGRITFVYMKYGHQ